MYPPILKSKQFTLKPYQQVDEKRAIETALDPISQQFMGGNNNNPSLKKVFEIYERTDDRWFWLWGIYKDDLLCGHLELKETEHTNENELEIVYMIHPEERRKGVMTEVLSLLKTMQKSWERRIIATVSAKNVNSIALLKKWGIDKEEVLVDSETGKEYLKLTLSA